MIISLKNKILLGATSLLLAFGIGRYTAQIGSAPATKTVADVKVDTVTDSDQQKHEVETITKKPDGEVTTVITEDTNTVATQNQESVSHTETTVTPPKINTMNISALVGVDLPNSLKPLYGASFTKQFLGPISIGAWGLTNGTLGVSVGINF